MSFFSFLLLHIFANTHNAQVALPVSGIESEILSYKKFDGIHWIGAREGVYVIEDGETKANFVNNMPKNIATMFGFDEKLYFVSENWVGYLEAGTNIRGVFPPPVHVETDDVTFMYDQWNRRYLTIRATEEFDGAIFIATNSEILYLKKNEQTLRPLKELGSNPCVRESAPSDQGVKLQNQYCSLHVFRGKLVIGTKNGLFSIDKGQISPKPVEPEKIKDVYRIAVFENHLWVLSKNALSKMFLTVRNELKIDTPKYLYGDGGVTLSDLENFEDVLWVRLFVNDRVSINSFYEKGTGKAVEIRNSNIIKIKRLGIGKYWAITNFGQGKSLEYLFHDQPKEEKNYFWNSAPVEEFRDKKIEDIYQNNSGFWISTEDGLYFLEKDKTSPKKIVSAKNVRVLNYDENILWFMKIEPTGKSELFYVESDISMEPVVASDDSFWKEMVNWLAPAALIAGTIRVDVKYVKNGRKITPEGIDDTRTKVFTSEDVAKCDREDEEIERDTSTIKEGWRPLLTGWGTKSICVAALDEKGNFKKQVLTYTVVPDIFSSLFFVPLFSITVTLIILLLAPYSKFCHDLLMNKFVRRWLSFGLIPVLLSVFPPARRYVFKRYMREINNDKEYLEWRERFVYPSKEFYPEEFGQKLNLSRRLLLLGSSGIGKTSYFKHLMASYTNLAKQKLLPKKVVPVFVRLSSFRAGTTPDRMIFDRFQNYGKMSDDTLNEWFLKQGGFLIFFDGINEIPNADLRVILSEFVERNWMANYIALSSQEIFSEFNGLIEVKVEPLKKEKVDELLRKRLGEKRATEVISEFTEDAYHMYQIPRDLEFAIEIKQRPDNPPLPMERNALYEQTLQPVISGWEDGKAEYPYLLYARAYRMLVSGDTVFNRKEPDKPEIPDQLIKDLCSRNYRYLVQYEDKYQFRHDLIRSYLASKYFCGRWNRLLTDETDIDRRWLEMLKFSIPVIDDSESVNVLMKKVLEKSSETTFVGELFNWLRTEHSHLCKDWENSFLLRFAEIKLEEIRN